MSDAKRIILLLLASMLLSTVTGCTHRRETSIHTAAMFGNVREIKRFLADGVDIDSLNSQGKTALWYAAESNRASAVEYLLSEGATPDLYIASRLGDIAMTRALLPKIADLNRQDDLGNTPLSCAIAGNHVEILELLISAGTDIHAKSDSGATYLHAAAFHCCPQVVEQLIAHGIDVNARDKKGKTPLMHALESYNPEKGESCARLLMDKGADVTISPKWGYTPLQQALQNNQCDLVKEMIEKGAQPDIYVASGMGDVHRVKKLIAEGADVNAKDPMSYTALDWAAQGGHLEVAELLVDSGADVNSKNKLGYTPLHMAFDPRKSLYTPEQRLFNAGAMDRKAKVAEFLVSKGADINARTETDNTPLDRAERWGYRKSASWLRAQGAVR